MILWKPIIKNSSWEKASGCAVKGEENRQIFNTKINTEVKIDFALGAPGMNGSKY